MACIVYPEITASSQEPASFEALKQINIFISMSHRLNHKGESSTMTCFACNIPLSIRDVHHDTFQSVCVCVCVALHELKAIVCVFVNN